MTDSHVQLFEIQGPAKIIYHFNVLKWYMIFVGPFRTEIRKHSQCFLHYLLNSCLCLQSTCILGHSARLPQVSD
jgi:hypothetical protein